MCQLASLRRNPLEQVIDKRVHDGHGLRRDPSVRMYLLQDLVIQLKLWQYRNTNLVDVDGVRLLPLSLALLLVALGNRLGGFARLGSSFSRSLGWHS